MGKQHGDIGNPDDPNDIMSSTDYESGGNDGRVAIYNPDGTISFAGGPDGGGSGPGSGAGPGGSPTGTGGVSKKYYLPPLTSPEPDPTNPDDSPFDEPPEGPVVPSNHDPMDKYTVPPGGTIDRLLRGVGGPAPTSTGAQNSTMGSSGLRTNLRRWTERESARKRDKVRRHL